MIKELTILTLALPAIGGTFPSVAPETLTWRTNVIANSGTFTFLSLQGVNQLVMGLHIYRLWTNCREIGPLAGSNFNAAAVKLKWDNNIVASGGPFTYTETNGMTGDGSTRLDLQTTVLGPTNTSLWIYKRTTNSNNEEIYFGASNVGANPSELRWSAAEQGILDGGAVGNVFVSASTTRQKGLLGVSSYSTATNSYYTNGVVSARGVSPVSGGGAANIGFLSGYNNISADQPSIGTFGLYIYGSGFRDEDALYLNYAVRLYESCLGRNVQ